MRTAGWNALTIAARSSVADWSTGSSPPGDPLAQNPKPGRAPTGLRIPPVASSSTAGSPPLQFGSGARWCWSETMRFASDASGSWSPGLSAGWPAGHPATGFSSLPRQDGLFGDSVRPTRQRADRWCWRNGSDGCSGQSDCAHCESPGCASALSRGWIVTGLPAGWIHDACRPRPAGRCAKTRSAQQRPKCSQTGCVQVRPVDDGARARRGDRQHRAGEGADAASGARCHVGPDRGRCRSACEP